MSNEPSWVQARSNGESEIVELSEKLREAELQGDVAFLDRVLVADFIGIGPRGFVLTKEAWLGRHRSDDLKYESIERDDVTVRTYGGTAIFTSRETSKTRYKGQAVPGGSLRTTHIFVRRGSDWRLAGVQMSPILGPL